MVGVHQSVRAYSVRFLEELRRHNYVTPKNYLDYVGAYKAALGDKRQEIDDMAARLDGGLQKLVQAAAEVGGPAGSGAVWLLLEGMTSWSAGVCTCSPMWFKGIPWQHVTCSLISVAVVQGELALMVL
jgi:hypothetical protein